MLPAFVPLSLGKGTDAESKFDLPEQRLHGFQAVFVLRVVRKRFEDFVLVERKFGVEFFLRHRFLVDLVVVVDLAHFMPLLSIVCLT